jgi:cation diffusion facilitator family transporter
MHTHSLQHWQYDHDYLPQTQRQSERRARYAFVLTLIMMMIELIAGYATGSLALTADGWHMSSHAVALGIGVFAYAFSRHHVHNTRFTFGTGKVGPLAGYTSALILASIALFMVGQSVVRLLRPININFNDAILVAVIGLIVNLACAMILGHQNYHKHAADDRAHHHDQNLRSAYLHVLADALTSVLAIIALVSGKYLGWNWMDPVMGIVGAAIIGQWCASLLRSSAHVILVAEDNSQLIAHIAQRIENDADNRIADLHVWRLGPLSHGCIVSLVTHEPQPAEYYKALLAEIHELEHITIEVNQCCQDSSTS